MSTPNAPDLAAENAELRARLAEAEETLEAIRTGAVDALVTAGPGGDQVFTLQGAETPYRLLIESMNEGAATLTPEGTILYCNRRFAEMVATPPEQVIGSSLWQWVSSAHEPIVRSLVVTAQHAGARAELTFSTPHGPELPVLLSLKPIEMDSHSIGVVAADLTERKRAEEALRQANDVLEQRVADRTEELRREREWLSVTLKSIGDALIATDADGHVSFLNPVAETLTGWPREEALGQPVQSVFRIVDETTRASGEDIVGRVLREGGVIKLANNTCLISRAGREIPIEDSGAPIKDSDGKVVGAVLVFHDVTEKRRAQHALRESEERLRLLVDGTKDCALFMLDPQGRITTWNEGARRLKGYQADEVVGRHFALFYTLEDVAAGRPGRELETAQREGKYEEEGERVRQDGSRFWASVLITVLTDEQGRLRGFSKVVRDITARKQAEEAVRQSEVRLKRSEEIAHLGSWELDLAQDRLTWSDEVYRIFGLQPQEFGATYEAFLERVHPDDRQKVDDAYSSSLRENRATYEVEHRVVRKGTGEVRVVQEKCEHFRNAAGQVIRSVGMVQDITERKQAEAALRQSEERLRLALNATNVGTWDYNPVTGALLWDARCKELFGLPPECEVNYDKFLAGLHPEDRERANQVVQGTFNPASGGLFDIEYRTVGLRDGGVLHWIHATGRASFNDAGQAIRFIGTVQDISERKQAEEALTRQREELQLILDSAPALIFYKDRENHFLRVNRAFADSMGMTKEQLEGKSLFDLYPREQAEAYWRDDQEVLASGRPKLNIVEPMHTAAGDRWVETGKVPCRDAQGNLTGIIGFALDITERQQAEAALREGEARAKVAEAVQFERQRLAAVLNMLPAYVVLLSPDYRVPFANRFFEERFGKSEGRPCYEYLFNRTEPCDVCETFKVLKTNAPLRWAWTGPDGRNYDIYDFPFTDVDGSPLIMEVGLDITERKQAEAELGKHRERLQELVDERTAELRATNEELTRFNEAMVGRELRMIELKQEIDALCGQLGQPPRYGPLSGEEAQPPQ